MNRSTTYVSISNTSAKTQFLKARNFIQQPKILVHLNHLGEARLNSVYNYLSDEGNIVLPPNCKENRCKL